MVLITLLFSNQGNAKDKKMKFGKVSMDDLEMKVYAPDTSASAVILYESGVFDVINNNFHILRRIKILKKEGYSMANNEFQNSGKSSVRGITFNLENGNIVESKLERSSIFEERVWDYKYVLNVAMPDVKVGSVMDIEVTYRGFPFLWFFQHSVPTVKSEFILGETSYYTFREYLGGFIQPEKAGFNHWIAEDIPAFIEEPYMNSSKNYLTRIEIELTESHIPGGRPMEYAYSWESVDKYLINSTFFGDALSAPSNFINKYADEINAKATTDSDKVKLAVEKIKSITKWNKLNRVFHTSGSLPDMFKEDEMSSADINFMLIRLLQKLEINVVPLVMSTRDNGLLYPNYPSLWKLNYVLAYAMVDNKYIPLDATSEDLPYDMLPVRCLNYTGRVISQSTRIEADLFTDKKHSQRIFWDLALDNTMTLKGNFSYQKMGYAAYDFRKDFKKYLSQSDYVDNLMSRKNGFIVSDFTIENIDSVNRPIVEKYNAEIEDAIIVIDNQAFFNMFLYEQINENPFKAEERRYPVDFIYGRATTGVVRLTLPENLTVAELPESASISLPDNAAKFTMMYQLDKNVLTLNYKLLINWTIFNETDYTMIRQFYGLVVDSQSKPVIFNLN